MRTYGRAILKRGTWHVTAEPHVAIRLRRLFKKAGNQFGTVKLKATDEVSRDLLWFTTRYPLEVEPRQALVERAAAFDARVETFDAVLSGRSAPRDFDMALPARTYQRVAADLALQTGGLLIADDVGLGKTCSAIAALTAAETRPALVVTLTHLPKQWQAELARFAPSLRTHVVKKGTPYDVRPTRRRRAADQLALLRPEDEAPPFPDVLIVNYHKLAGWSEELAGKIRTVVFDEVQELRRAESGKYNAAKHLADACDYRIGLSATPVYNYGIEIFNIMQILRPGALGSRSEFVGEWCRGAPGDDPNRVPVAQPRAFGTYLREAALMIRRTRVDVGRELPHLTKSVVHVDANTKALDAVASDVAELARIILAQGGPWNVRGQAARDLDWRLRQATGIAKAPYVAEFVKLLVESGENVVLYGWHREFYSIVKDRLAGCAPVFYTGSESTTAKEESKRAFIEGDAKVLVMSLRAGAGLDGLQGHCRTVVFGELDWSPGVHDQAIGRVHRDGQGEPVVAYYLVSDSGSDPVLMDALGIKREQADGVRDPDAKLVQTVKVDAARTLAESYLRQRGLEVPGVESAAAASHG